MNPRAINFQLLLAFDALMCDPQVTRAAKAVGVSQPAMSHMLARLRDQFGDPLLVRTARGMEPTSYALSVVERLAAGEPAFRCTAVVRSVLIRHGLHCSNRRHERVPYAAHLTARDAKGSTRGFVEC